MFDRVFNYLLIGFASAAGAVLIFIWLSVNYEVVMRYFLNRPTTWVVDYNQIALLYLNFLAMAWVLSKDGHVKIELLLEHLRPRTQRVLNTITSAIGALLSVLLFWYGIVITSNALETGEWYISGVLVPKWIIFIIIPIGSSLLILQFIRRAINATKGKAPEKVAKEHLAPV